MVKRSYRAQSLMRQLDTAKRVRDLVFRFGLIVCGFWWLAIGFAVLLPTWATFTLGIVAVFVSGMWFTMWATTEFELRNIQRELENEVGGEQ